MFAKNRMLCDSCMLLSLKQADIDLTVFVRPWFAFGKLVANARSQNGQISDRTVLRIVRSQNGPISGRPDLEIGHFSEPPAFRTARSQIGHFS